MGEKPEDAYSDLHVFAAIEVICVNSIMRTGHGRETARKIARMCNAEQQVQLKAYDQLRERP